MQLQTLVRMLLSDRTKELTHKAFFLEEVWGGKLTKKKNRLMFR